MAWLESVRNTWGLDTAIEVATPEQVQEALHAQIPYLWIGARTAANPIAVQAIADSIITTPDKTQLKGLFVKNPICDDVRLWVGNIQRLQQTGTEVIAIHRGCNHQPCWEMAYQLRQLCPQVHLLIDPSHMSGKAEVVPSLCQQANKLGYNGWMVETHLCPQQALSDAAQQIVPSELTRLIADNTEPQTVNDLTWLRKIMDETDNALWNTIAKRMQISQQIGEWKKQHHVPIVQPERYNDILSKRKQWGQSHHISDTAIEQIIEAIHTESVKQQA